MTKRSSPMKSRLIFTACSRPSGASCGMYAMLTPQRLPSPTASRICGPVSPMTMPTSVRPASRMASMTRKSTGLLATGINCLALVKVSGFRRVPLPPLRMRPFMEYPLQKSVGGIGEDFGFEFRHARFERVDLLVSGMTYLMLLEQRLDVGDLVVEPNELAFQAGHPLFELTNPLFELAYPLLKLVQTRIDLAKSALHHLDDGLNDIFHDAFHVALHRLYVLAQSLYVLAQSLYVLAQSLYVLAQSLYVLAQSLYVLAQSLYVLAQRLNGLLHDDNHFLPVFLIHVDLRSSRCGVDG